MLNLRLFRNREFSLAVSSATFSYGSAFAAGFLSLSAVDIETPMALVVGTLVVTGVGAGLYLPPIFSAALDGVGEGLSASAAAEATRASLFVAAALAALSAFLAAGRRVEVAPAPRAAPRTIAAESQS
jgi:hypothetical protein